MTNLSDLFPPPQDTSKINGLNKADSDGFQVYSSDTGWKYNIIANNPDHNFGDGSDGDFIGGTTSNPSAYTDLTINVAIDDDVLTVRDASAFAVGDEVLIHQTQVGTDLTAGNLALRGIYEYGIIQAKDDAQAEGSDTITLTTGLIKAFKSDSNGDKANNIKTQILKVYNYDDMDLSSGGITAPAWDGYKGGILAFRVQGTLTGANNIVMTGLGFRPGGYNLYPIEHWTHGEGWSGMEKGSITNPTLYSGGNQGLSPSPRRGAGGGHAFVGEASESGVPGGQAYGLSDLTAHINLGGGGGYEDTGGNPGGSSGGAIMLFVFDISTYTGSVISNGNNGSSGGDGGGSGSGGSVFLVSKTPFYGGSVTSNGATAYADGGDGYLERKII